MRISLIHALFKYVIMVVSKTIKWGEKITEDCGRETEESVLNLEMTKRKEFLNVK